MNFVHSRHGLPEKRRVNLKKILFLALTFFAASYLAFAQEFGSIKGTVKDPEGNPLPGVTVTLTGTKIPDQTFITTASGSFRFISLPVADDYAIKFELPGFKTIIRERQVVSFGRDTIYDITMEVATIEETVTVVGQSPVIDTKRTQVGVNITEEMIMSLPTARNPWTLMTLVPGMLVAKEDVGGNEAGQQYGYSGHGSLGRDNTWNIDGANITDNAALGAAPAYLNIPSYEEVQINYGNNDVKSQTGGVQLNMVTRRGGNVFSGMFYLDAEDQKWQSSNVSQEMKDWGYVNPGIQKVYLYGANFGGPIIKDRIWFYGSWGIQDLQVTLLGGPTDKTWLQSGYAKLNFQITPTTRAEAFLEYDNKLKWNRNDYYESSELSPETYWNQDGPGYIWKGEIDQTFGNLYLNLKAIYLDMSFYLHTLEIARGKPFTISYYPIYHVSGAMDDYGTTRPNTNIVFTGNYFAEKVLGADHEFKFGVDYQSSTVTSFDYYEGNVNRYYYGPDPSMPNGEYWEAEVKRDVNLKQWRRRWAIFAQDTMTIGRLSINLGIRYDNETSMVKDQKVPASPFLSHLLPSLEIAKLDPGLSWSVISPRISFIYDLFGTGKDVLKLSLARYGSQEGYGMSYFLNPMGWCGIGVLWQDGVGGPADGVVQNGELYGVDGAGHLAAPNANTILWAWGVNVDDPTSVETFNKIDPNFNSPLLDELTASYEKELFTDFRASLEFYYKKAHRGIWDIPMAEDGTLETSGNYYVYRTEPITGFPVYAKTKNIYFYSYRTNYAKRNSTYYAGQLVLVKRLSNKWMLDASFTYSSWKAHYEGEFIDPQNVTYFDGGANASMNSRWQFKLSGLYQLPLGINIGGVFRAREGYVRGTYLRVTGVPGIGTRTVYGNPDGGGKYGDMRLPAFYELDLRLEKVFQVSERSRVLLSADAFNALNYAHVLARQDLITSTIFGRQTRILNPRVFRFGVRFEF